MSPTSLPLAMAASPPFGVLLVDDQQTVRDGISRLIACTPESLRCVGTAATGAQALSAARALRPDIVILDVDLNGEDGLSLLPELLIRARVLVLTCQGDRATRERALRLGAGAFLEKHRPAAELLGALLRLGALGRPSGQDKTPPPQGSSSPLPMAPSSGAPGNTDA